MKAFTLSILNYFNKNQLKYVANKHMIIFN